MRAIDSNMLLMFFRPGVLVPNGPDGKPISSPKARIGHLIETLEEEGARLLIATPVLTETIIKDEMVATRFTPSPRGNRRLSKACGYSGETG